MPSKQGHNHIINGIFASTFNNVYIKHKKLL